MLAPTGTAPSYGVIAIMSRTPQCSSGVKDRGSTLATARVGLSCSSPSSPVPKLRKLEETETNLGSLRLRTVHQPSADPEGGNRGTDAADINAETARVVLDACIDDLDREEARMATIDGKLTQLAAFSGVSISISAGVGGSVVAADRLRLGFLIALGACLVSAAVLLLLAIVRAFSALSPKLYKGVDDQAVIDRTRPSALRGTPESMLAQLAGSRRDMLQDARIVNDQKADSASAAFLLVGLGFASIVAALLVIAVGAVV